MKINYLHLLLCSFLLIMSCFEGPIGPEGPDGRQGIQGPQGPQGVPGNANVKSYSYNIALNSFSYWSDTNEWWKYQNVGTSIASTDAVLGYVYEKHAGVYEWMAMPMLDYWNTGSCFNAFNYSITDDDRIQLSIRNSCGTNPYNNMATASLNYRFFVIKGMGKQILDSLDTRDYMAVTQALGFEE